MSIRAGAVAVQMQRRSIWKKGSAKISDGQHRAHQPQLDLEVQRPRQPLQQVVDLEEFCAAPHVVDVVADAALQRVGDAVLAADLAHVRHLAVVALRVLVEPLQQRRHVREQQRVEDGARDQREHHEPALGRGRGRDVAVPHGRERREAPVERDRHFLPPRRAVERGLVRDEPPGVVVLELALADVQEDAGQPCRKELRNTQQE